MPTILICPDEIESLPTTTRSPSPLSLFLSRKEGEKHALFLCCGEIYQANTVNWATCVAACDLSLNFCWRHFFRQQSCFHIQVVFIFYILQISSFLFSSKQVTIHRVGENGQTPYCPLDLRVGYFYMAFKRFQSYVAVALFCLLSSSFRLFPSETPVFRVFW